MLRIRDVYPGSRLPIFFHPGSQICIKEFKYFNSKKWFLSSRKYDSGCSSRILFFYPSRIPDIGVKKAPDPGSATLKLRKNFQKCVFNSKWKGWSNSKSRVFSSEERNFQKCCAFKIHRAGTCLRRPISRAWVDCWRRRRPSRRSSPRSPPHAPQTSRTTRAGRRCGPPPGPPQPAVMSSADHLQFFFWCLDVTGERHHLSHTIVLLASSVADPNPSDPYVFGPPGSGSTCQRSDP